VIAANCRSDNTVATHASHSAPHDSAAETDLLTADDGWDDDDMDDEVGACDICYALHLPDPLQPTELGEHLVAAALACTTRVLYTVCFTLARRMFNGMNIHVMHLSGQHICKILSSVAQLPGGLCCAGIVWFAHASLLASFAMTGSKAVSVVIDTCGPTRWHQQVA